MSPDRAVGPYRLVDRLGRGGMGEVWLAEDLTGAAGGAPRRVALKLLDPYMAGDPDARTRFAREVEAARRVRGPFVAAVLDADVDAAEPWIASAYVAGPTLAEHVSRHGALADAPLRAVGAALAGALVSIHAAGVIHRDLTPGNVVLGPDGPRVVDFGIALFPGAVEITRTGSWVGTPSWMAPERLAGGAVTSAVDIWSWGAVMAYAALGRPAVSPPGGDPAGGAARGGGPGDAGARPGAAARAGPGRRGGSGVPGDVLARLPPWLAPWVDAALDADPSARPRAQALLDAMVAGGPASTAHDPADADVPPTRRDPGVDVPSTHRDHVPLTRRIGFPEAEPYDVGTAHRGREGPRSRRGGRRSPDRDAGARTGTGSPDGGRHPSRLLRLVSGLAVVAVAAGLGAVLDLLLAVIALAVLVVAAVVVRVSRESVPPGEGRVPPTWSVALAGPVVLGVALVLAFGPVGGLAALAALVVLFFLLGGDIA